MKDNKNIIIELKNVSKHYDQTYAVEDFNLYVKKGEFVTFLGPSGCGKTTTLRMIATLIRPDEGTVEILGHDNAKEPDFARSKIGFLTSELKLEDYFTPNYLFD